MRIKIHILRHPVTTRSHRYCKFLSIILNIKVNFTTSWHRFFLMYPWINITFAGLKLSRASLPYYIYFGFFWSKHEKHFSQSQKESCYCIVAPATDSHKVIRQNSQQHFIKSILNDPPDHNSIRPSFGSVENKELRTTWLEPGHVPRALGSSTFLLPSPAFWVPLEMGTSFPPRVLTGQDQARDARGQTGVTRRLRRAPWSQAPSQALILGKRGSLHNVLRFTVFCLL